MQVKCSLDMNVNCIAVGHNLCCFQHLTSLRKLKKWCHERVLEMEKDDKLPSFLITCQLFKKLLVMQLVPVSLLMNTEWLYNTDGVWLVSETLAGALPVKAMKDLLVISGLVAVLLQIGSSVWGILGQHQLHISTERQTMAMEEQHRLVQPTAYSTIRIYTHGGEREINVLSEHRLKRLYYLVLILVYSFLFLFSHHDTVVTVWCNGVHGRTSAGW